MRNALVLLAIICINSLNAQDFDAFIQYAESLSEADRQEVVDSFMNASNGFPYLEADQATFIYRGNVSSVQAVGDFNSWSPGQAYSLQQLTGTNFWYHSHEFEPNARLDYKLIVNGSDWILDPLNPNLIPGGFGPNSELAMPAYVQPWEIVDRPGVAQGQLITTSIASTALQSTYQLKIYLPPNYQGNDPVGYATAYIQDGFEAVDLGRGVQVLNNLIDSLLIDPIIAVFVRPNDRNNEYGFEDKNAYMDFFINELIPYVDSNYNTIANSRHRAIMGASLGGNISAYISRNHPSIIGNCGIHSGALWPNNNEVYNLITNGQPTQIRYASIWGSYEGLSSQMTALSNYFDAAGNDHIRAELPEGHSWGLWRSTLDDFLKFFFGYLTTSIESDFTNTDLGIYLLDGHLHIDWNDTWSYDVTVSLIDMAGKTYYQNTLPAGTDLFHINLSNMPSGIYSVSIRSGKEVVSKLFWKN